MKKAVELSREKMRFNYMMEERNLGVLSDKENGINMQMLKMEMKFRYMTMEKRE